MFSKGRILKMLYTHFFIHDLIARVHKAFIVSLRDKNGFNDAKSLFFFLNSDGGQIEIMNVDRKLVG